MKKIKVLHLIQTLNLGGAESNLYNLTTSLDTNNIDVHIGYSFGGHFEAKFLNSGIILFKYAQGNYKVKSIMSFLIILRIIKYVIKNDIKIIHTHTFNAHVWGSIAGVITGRKVLEHVHDPRYEEAKYLLNTGANPKQFKYSKYFAKISNKIIVLTEANKEYLLRHHICKESKVTVVMNGIKITKKLYKSNINISLRKAYGVSYSNRVVLSAGRIETEKNFKLIIEIADHLRETNNNLIFIIAGEGSLKNQLIDEVKKRKIDSIIRFIGYCPNIKRLLYIADIFILPSTRELNSITILEALCEQVAVITSKNVGNNSDLLTNNVNALLLNPYSWKEWCEIIMELLNNENKLNYIAENGRKLVENKCDINITARIFENIYYKMENKILRAK